MLDLLIVVGYFAIIFITAITGRHDKEVTTEQYFLSNRSLRWPSIAFSTIATNIQGYQFLGMMGSAYLYGIAQASLEINAVQGILIAAFIFVPLYLKDRVITITQFINKRLGPKIGLAYSLANLLLFSTITLGAALFWGAYAAELVFEDYLLFLHENRLIRISILLVGLGAFSAVYTYFGGLSAVVRTDIIQFAILLIGGLIVMFITVRELGGWQMLYVKTPELMKLHLPADHEKLPWTHMFGLFFLNINYWCANQSVMQRSLAAKNLKQAQIGLMVGGVSKYLMAAIIVIPGIALAGILGAGQLEDPDMAFPRIVEMFLPTGLKGLILCALFASLMSTVDSTFNSLATLWSIDIYKTYLKPKATDREVVGAGKQTIIVTLFTGILMGMVLLYLKFENPDAAFTHTLNELRYYINCGIVLLICTAAFMLRPNRAMVLVTFLMTAYMNYTFSFLFPDMNYFVRAFWVIFIGLLLIASGQKREGWRSPREILQSDNRTNSYLGAALLISLIALHLGFH
ncbi:MAG: SLC5 family protein [Bacteroidia bacterium]